MAKRIAPIRPAEYASLFRRLPSGVDFRNEDVLAQHLSLSEGSWRANLVDAFDLELAVFTQ
jgi:hypothetical protein